MSSRRAAALAATVVAIGLIASLVLSGPPTRAPREGIRASVSVVEALGAVPTGYARAEGPREFTFPADHGPHPAFRTEWWYYTGHLRARDGREFGFQLTFFRTALTPAPARRESPWAAHQLYMAHFALTDVRGGRFLAFGRSGRGALGLAGARAEPFRVWVDDWAAEGEPGRPLATGDAHLASGSARTAMRLRAAEADAGIDLALDATRPPAFPGERGWSRKGPEPGNASFYYSLTRLSARGTVQAGAERVEVEGQAWMDREWSSNALAADLVGWDWFALQLDDGRDLMLYRLRRPDGSASPWSGGILVDPDGRTSTLGAQDVVVDVTRAWTSPRSGVRYPAGWRLRWAPADLTLDLTPRVPDQELDVGVRYWEGAVTVVGRQAGRAVAGLGYVELVGYGERRPRP
ncbi:MAG: lipocalin-like domain-containing protein [Candidatus Rokuibacteriota bacterium]